jgi:hypothetical protein
MTDEMINIIVKSLQMASYVSITVAFMVGWYKGREIQIFERILFTVALTAFIAFYNPILDEGTKMFQEMTASSDSQIDAYLEKCRTVRIEGDSGFFDDFMTSLQASFFKFLLACTGGLRFISGLLQAYFIVAFKIMAPIVLGLAAWEIFRSNLGNFILYSIGVMIWSIGYQIADIFVLEGIVLIGVPSALSAGTGAMVITGGGALIGLIVFLLALFFGMCIFYILTPIVMFSVLSGANPGTAVTGNMRTAAIASMAVAKPAGMIAQKSISVINKTGTKINNASNSLYGKVVGKGVGGGKTSIPQINLKTVGKAMGKGR